MLAERSLNAVVPSTHAAMRAKSCRALRNRRQVDAIDSERVFPPPSFNGPPLVADEELARSNRDGLLEDQANCP